MIKIIMILSAGLVLSACTKTIEEEFIPPRIVTNNNIETVPLPPPRPFNLGKRCWVETKTTQHAVIERRYCR